MMGLFRSTPTRRKEDLLGLALIALTLFVLLPFLKARIQQVPAEAEDTLKPLPVQATLVSHQAPAEPVHEAGTAEEVK